MNNEQLITAAKITKATFKSFLKRNAGNLHILVRSTFDGMTDCCEQTGQKAFAPARETTRDTGYTYGYEGIYLVNGGGDRFSLHNSGGFLGIRVYNCCGSFTVAVPATTPDMATVAA